jgi:enoyl-[acyl-carrier protein] reductase II
MAASTEAGVFGFGRDEPVDLERTCLPSGQGVGGIDEILPAGEIVRRVVAEAKETIDRIASLAGGDSAG